MKIKMLVAAVATMSAGQAFALLPSALDASTVEIYQSGASAQQNTMQSLLTQFCAAGTLDQYRTSDDSYRNYFCQFKTTAVEPTIPASLSGKKVVFYTRAKGGSSWGVIPVGKNWNTQFLDLDSCTLTASPHTCTITTPATVTVAAATGTECPTNSTAYPSSTDRDTRCRIPDFGVSDVEPNLFVGNNLDNSFASGLTSSESASLTVKSNYGVVFGFSVSNNVRDALIANGYRVPAPAGVAAGHTVTVSGVPYVANLSKAAIRSLMSGAITNWGQLNSALTSIAGGGYMMACRRVNGSGTQAAAQIQFLDDPCHSGPKGGALPMVSSALSSGAYLVYENEGSGDVELCQNDAHRATSVEVDTFGAEWGAWGINAINRSISGDSWSFVAVDGIWGSVAGARDGSYDNIYEQTTQYKTAISGEKGDFVRLFATEFQKEARIIASGATGVVAIPGVAGNVYNPAAGLVSRVTRGGNSCNSHIIVQ